MSNLDKCICTFSGSNSGTFVDAMVPDRLVKTAFHDNVNVPPVLLGYQAEIQRLPPGKLSCYAERTLRPYTVPWAGETHPGTVRICARTAMNWYSRTHLRHLCTIDRLD